SEWMSRRGMAVVFLSRFAPGLRLPTYVAAGALKTRFWRFMFYFLLAAAIWTPLLVGAAALAGSRILGVMRWFGVAVVLVSVIRIFGRGSFSDVGQVGNLRRVVNPSTQARLPIARRLA